jgi:hypothetical protein
VLPISEDLDLPKYSLLKTRTQVLARLFVYLSICLLARSCLGAARPRCIVAPGVPLERTPPASPPGFSRAWESLHLVD